MVLEYEILEVDQKLEPHFHFTDEETYTYNCWDLVKLSKLVSYTPRSRIYDFELLDYFTLL